MNSVEPCSSILVLCEGNLCRSPIAAGLLQNALGPGFRVASAGLAARAGCPPDPEAVRLMAGRDLDISGHASRPVTPAMVLEAGLILVMDPRQKDWCTALAPTARGRVFLLGHWRNPPEAIDDPYQRGPEAFRTAFEAISLCVTDWATRILTVQRSA